MSRNTRGCGCVVAVLAVVAVAFGGLYYKFGNPFAKKNVPPPSGKELKVVVFDVGQGDSILIVSPAGKSMLIDAGDQTKGKLVVDDLKKNGVEQLDYLVATHMHPDHIGGAPEVLGAFKVGTVLHNGVPPTELSEDEANQSGTSIALNKALGKNGKPQPKAQPKPQAGSKGRKAVNTSNFPTVIAYNNFKTAVSQNGAKMEQSQPGQRIDLGGGTILTVMAPAEPFFTKEQMKEGGNEPNANSIVMRLDYGDFSMMLMGDAEAQTEQRLMAKDPAGNAYTAKVIKIAHHGSKYATTPDFIKSVKPEAAIISVGEYNRYGQPAQKVLDAIKSSGLTKVYRTDFQGDITITSDGKDYKVKTGKGDKDKTNDVWAGREGTKDDSSRSGFISYGDFGPPPKPKPEKTKK